MREDNFALTIQISPFVHDEHRDEICQLNDSLLIVIDLGSFDLDKFIRNVFSNVEHTFFSQHMLNHLVVFGF
jgi:hypothetical protein